MNRVQGSPALSPAESTNAITRPLISISALDTQIAEGVSARFVIKSQNGGSSTNITVSLQVHHEHVNINVPANLNVQLSGHDTRLISISTLNDNNANKDGFVNVTISEDPSYLISRNEGSATVRVSDAADRQNRVSANTEFAQAFLPEITGTIGSGTLSTISERIELGFSGDGNQILKLGGQNSASGILTTSGEAINKNSMTLKSFIGDSSFAISVLSGDEIAVPTTIWGIGDYQNIYSARRNETIDWSGDLFTGHFGIDTLVRERLLVGISASVAESEIQLDEIDTEQVQFDMQTTSLNPYVGWTTADRTSELHVMAGYGQGQIGIDQDAYKLETLDSELYSIGMSGSQLLFMSDSIWNGTSSLSVKGESWFATQNVDGKVGVLENINTIAQHLNIKAEGTHQFDFATGSTLNPIISVGLRRDVKDQLSVQGLEFTGGTEFQNPIGLSLSGHGSMLIGQANQVQKIGLNSSLNYDQGHDERGILFEVSSSWGQTDTEIQDSFWTENNLNSANSSALYSSDTKINTELGYGLNILDNGSSLTPFTGFDFSQYQNNEYLIGTRMNIGSNAQFDLTGTQSVSSMGQTSNKVRLEGKLSW